jgi:hypothetical protein
MIVLMLLVAGLTVAVGSFWYLRCTRSAQSSGREKKAVHWSHFVGTSGG